jgi:hypothetical protein
MAEEPGQLVFREITEEEIVDETIDGTVDETVEESIDGTIDESVHGVFEETIDESVHETIREPVNEPFNEPVHAAAPFIGSHGPIRITISGGSEKSKRPFIPRVGRDAKGKRYMVRKAEDSRCCVIL